MSALPENALRNNGGNAPNIPRPVLFSKRFMDVIASALDEGYISARRAASLLDTDMKGLEELFASHGIDCPFDI